MFYFERLPNGCFYKLQQHIGGTKIIFVPHMKFCNTDLRFRAIGLQILRRTISKFQILIHITRKREPVLQNFISDFFIPK